MLRLTINILFACFILSATGYSMLLPADNDSSFTPLFLEARTALEQNDTTLAEKLLKKSVFKHKDTPSIFELAKLNAGKNTIRGRAEARRLVEIILWREPDNIEFRMLMATLAEKLGSNMAFKQYEKISRIDSTYARAWYNMGRIREADYNEYHNSISQEGNEPAISFEKFAEEDLKEAETYFLKAIKFDSLFDKSYLHLGFLYEDSGQPEKGIPVLEKLAELSPSNKEAHLYLGLLYYKTSRMLDSYKSYQLALAMMEPKEREDFTYNSVKMLLDPILSTRMNSYSDYENKDLFAYFWQIRDPLKLTEFNERLLEHYSRVAYSLLRFGVPDMSKIGWMTDRGEVMLRYGEPVRRVRLRPYINFGVHTEIFAKTDVWHYRDMSFGFTDDYMSGNFRFSVPSSGTIRSQFAGDSESFINYLRRVRFEMYTPRFEGPVFKMPYEIAQFRNLDKRNYNITDLYVSYGFGYADSLKKENGYQEAYRLGLFLSDKYFNSIYETRDSATVIPLSRVITVSGKDSLVVSSLPFSARPDSVNLAFEVIRKRDKGVSTNHFPVNIRMFNDDSLAISDLVLASNISEGISQRASFTRENISILPNVSHTFSSGENIYIYYEVYNLTLPSGGSGSLEQRITLRPAEKRSIVKKAWNSVLRIFGGGTSEEVTLTSRYRTNKENPQMYFQFDMSSYDPGKYILTASARDLSTGKEVSNSTEIIWNGRIK